jgi:hypothetical protein
MLLTPADANELACEENEHGAEARAPLSSKMRTARKREAAARPLFVFTIKVYVKRTAPRRESHGRAQVEQIARGLLLHTGKPGGPRRASARPRRVFDFEIDARLDVAGHRFGAAALGGARCSVSGAREKRKTVARKLR